jgi:hypothetical protein
MPCDHLKAGPLQGIHDAFAVPHVHVSRNLLVEGFTTSKPLLKATRPTSLKAKSLEAKTQVSGQKVTSTVYNSILGFSLYTPIKDTILSFCDNVSRSTLS